MNRTKENYENTLLDLEVLSEKQKQVDELSKEFILKINSLHSLGMRVSQKCFGRESSQVEDFRGYFLHSMEWFPYWNDPKKHSIQFTQNEILFKNPRFSPREDARSLTVPRQVLHLSDRDFAKIIRKSINSRKAHLRWYRAWKSKETIAEELLKIQELKESILKLEKDSLKIDALKDLRDNQKDDLWSTINRLKEF